MRNRRYRNSSQKLHINIAPLVEVMLVILLIFMLNPPSQKVGVSVDLPSTESAAKQDDTQTPIILTITKDSEIYIQDTKISIDELSKKLPIIMKQTSNNIVHVQADKDLSYGAILKIMDIISTTPGCKVSLISQNEPHNKYDKRNGRKRK
ncbi:MAG: biopolymer transporter ExbD [Alphaproteobacteria bacterium]|nr:biopolymer transporter ExbD [Alphaproteobacteria bacterium]